MCTGPEAFYRFIGETKGHFEFAPGSCELPERSRTIRENATSLILEGARILDTQTSAQRVRRPTPSIGSLAPQPQPELEPALEADATTAAQLAAGIADPFALGELCLWSAADLSKWTRRAVGTQRLHVHLIADMATGVSAILALTGGATERWVMNGLEPTRKAFGVSFFLRKERVVDIVLLDVSQPDVFEQSLKRVPTLTIFAPPNGDALGIEIRARVALENMLRRFQPPLVVAVGEARLRTDAGIAAMLGHARAVQFVPGLLGDGATDLRSVIVGGVHQWASAASPRPVTR